jgi:predicted nucleic acid-binding protein
LAVVVDASTVIELLSGATSAVAIDERLRNEKTDIHAPHLIDLEVAHAFRHAFLGGRITDEDGQRMFAEFDTLAIVRHSHLQLLGRIWALRQNLSAYDAAYVALAERLDVPLLTLDARLSRSSGHTARIELVG